jgi:ribonuclease E
VRGEEGQNAQAADAGTEAAAPGEERVLHEPAAGDADPPMSEPPAAAEGSDREGRRRGRGGRGRRERSEANAADAGQPIETGVDTGMATADAAPEREFVPAALAEASTPEPVAVATEWPAPEAAEPVALAAAPVVPVPAARVIAPLAVAAPQAFELPLDSLQAVAESAGLQWVNSDTDKIRAVQAAMAAEATPAHVPRERKAVAPVDEGALVLVETRKDLSQFKLPFETPGGSQPQA